jgi:hypothetical protein
MAMNDGKIFKFVKIYFCRIKNKRATKNLASYFMAINDKPLQVNM